MKREKYFRDELRRLFVGYAIIPSAVFTLACGIIFMAVLVYGKSRTNAEQNEYAAMELNRILTGYEEELTKLASDPKLLQKASDTGGRAGIFEDFYGASARLHSEASLFVLDKNREPVLSSQSGIPEYLRIDPELEWGIFQPMDRMPKTSAIRLAEPWNVPSQVLLMGRALLPEHSGYVVIAVGGNQFQPMLGRTDAQTIITDSFGWVYAGSNYNFVDSSNQILPELKKSGRYLTKDGHLYLVSGRTVYRGQFQVYTISDLQNIMVSLTLGGALVLTALVGMTAWVLMNSRKVTEKKTEDFYRILDVMEQARDGNLDCAIQTESTNEFRVIADACNEMIAGLKRQMENNRRMTELVAISQNKQLQSQFNPHFLYNTLENIRYMCKIEPSIAEKMVFSLSNLLRYSLDVTKTEVTVREDLTHLEHYLTILKYRFNRRFSYQIEVEPEAMDCRIPKLVLQPMIENSVKYGFGRQENLSVELKIYLHEGKLIMICRDDGVGMTPGMLSELTALLQQEENTSRHSGIYNIHRRIEILYGRPYGVEVRSAEGYGTTLVVTLPAHTKERT